MTQPKTIFEDMTFTVLDHAELGVEVSFRGLDDGEEVAGSKWFTDGAGVQIREICSRFAPEPARIAPLISQRTGIERSWMLVNRANTLWNRDGEVWMVHATRAKKENGRSMITLETSGAEQKLEGPFAEAATFEIEEARERASELSRGFDRDASASPSV